MPIDLDTVLDGVEVIVGCGVFEIVADKVGVKVTVGVVVNDNDVEIVGVGVREWLTDKLANGVGDGVAVTTNELETLTEGVTEGVAVGDGVAL